MTGYDRSDLIDASIKTLQRDLPEEAAVLISFIPMYWLGVTNTLSPGGIAWRTRRFLHS